MSRNRLDKVLSDLQKLTDGEKRAVRHEINRQLGFTDKETTDELSYILNKYAIPVIEARSDLSYIQGWIGGVISVGGPDVIYAQVKRMGAFLKIAESALEMETAKALKNRFIAIFHADPLADALHQTLVEVYSGDDIEGKRAKELTANRLREALAARGPVYKELSEYRKLGPGQKAAWKPQLAEYWQKVEARLSDPTPHNVRKAMLEEIANPIETRTPGGRVVVDEWKLKPEHEDKENWLKSLMNKKARYKTGDYRAWLLKPD